MNPAGRKPHRAFVVLIALMMIQAGVMGVLYNCCGIVFTAIIDDLGFGAGDLSVYYMIRSFATAIFVGLTTKLYFGRHTRLVMGLLGVLYVGAFASMSLFSELWQWYIAAAIGGIGMSCTLVVIPATLNNWFKIKNGLMIGLTMSSSGVMGAVFSPLCSALIESFGWRSTVLIMAGIGVVLIILPCIFIASTPESCGLRPYGENNLASNEPAKTTGYSADEASSQTSMAASPLIYVLSLVALVGTSSLIQFNAQLPVYAQSIGYTLSAGAMLTSCSMVGNLIGKLGLGALSDRIGIYKAGALFLLAVGAGMLGLLFGQGSLPVLYVSSLLYGIVYCANTTMPSLLYLDIYGKQGSQGRVSSMQAIYNAIAAVLSAGFPYIYDWTGTFNGVIAFGAIISFMAVAILMWLRSRRAQA